MVAACRLCAVLVIGLAFSRPAAASEEFLLDTPDGLLVFQSDQARTDYIEWVKTGGRSAWLYFSNRMMKPCKQGLNDECHDNMVALRERYPKELKNAREVLNGVKDRFLIALRNGNFIYPVAPSFQLLQSIVGAPGTCATWSAIANKQLNMTSGGLKQLADDADTEIPTRTTYPERAELNGRNGRPGLLELARSCQAL